MRYRHPPQTLRPHWCLSPIGMNRAMQLSRQSVSHACNADLAVVMTSMQSILFRRLSVLRLLPVCQVGPESLGPDPVTRSVSYSPRNMLKAAFHRSPCSVTLTIPSRATSATIFRFADVICCRTAFTFKTLSRPPFCVYLILAMPSYTSRWRQGQSSIGPRRALGAPLVSGNHTMFSIVCKRASSHICNRHCVVAFPLFSMSLHPQL